MNRSQKNIREMKVRRDTSWQRYYYVTIPKFGGGRNRRFFARTPEGKREAETFLQLIKTQRENEGMEAFSIPQELRIEALKCQRLLEPASTTLTDAVQFFLKHAKPAGGTKSVADAIKEFLASKRKAGRRESYVRNLEFVLNCFKRDFQNQNVNDISRDGIESWLDRLNNLTSRKNRIRDLSVLFEFCRRRGYCGSNPLQNIERPTVTRGRPEIFSVAEATALLVTAERHEKLELVPTIAIGLFAGLRIEELKKLDWRNVHLDDKVIDVDESVAKTRQQRNVEMSDLLVAWCPFSEPEYDGVSDGAWHDGYFVQILSELSDQQERCGGILEDCSRVFGQQGCRFFSRYCVKLSGDFVQHCNIGTGSSDARRLRVSKLSVTPASLCPTRQIIEGERVPIRTPIGQEFHR